MPHKTLTVLKIAIASGMAIALLVWVQLSYGWVETLAAWKSVSAVSALAAAVLVMLSHFLRALRVHWAYAQITVLPLKKVTAVSLLHNTVSFLLPMRLGELALPVLSRHQLNVDLKYSTATLLLLRIFDAHVLLCLLCFFAGSLFLGRFALMVPVLLVLALPLFVLLVRTLGSRIIKLAFAAPLVKQHRSWLLLYGCSVMIWSIKLFALALLAAALGKLPIDHAWIATIIADGSALSPITGFANAGTFEAAFTLPLLPLGYAAEPLIKTAVNVHLFIFIINIGAGIVGFMLLGSRRTQEG